MKTYNQFLIEVIKLGLALKAGKLAFKTLKKIGLKSTTKKVPVKDITKSVSYTHLTLPTICSV